VPADISPSTNQFARIFIAYFILIFPENKMGWILSTDIFGQRMDG
jgi:hypothetical protein